MQVRYVSTSFLVHAAVIVAGILFLQQKQPVREATVITLEYQPTAESSQTSHSAASFTEKNSAAASRKSSAAGGARLSVRQKAAVLESLNMSEYDFSDSVALGDSAVGTNNKSSWYAETSYDNDPFALNDVSMTDIKFLQSLWHEIDTHIENNQFLSEYGHTGKVHFQFQLNALGELVQNSLQAKADDNVLKVIGARAIRKALAENHFLLPKEQKTLSVQFSWAAYESCRNLKGIQNHRMSFCRYAEDKRKTFEADEKAKTYAKSLIYGPGMIEEIQAYHREERRKDTKFDPFESHRRDPDWYL